MYRGSPPAPHRGDEISSVEILSPAWRFPPHCGDSRPSVETRRSMRRRVALAGGADIAPIFSPPIDIPVRL